MPGRYISLPENKPISEQQPVIKKYYRLGRLSFLIAIINLVILVTLLPFQNKFKEIADYPSRYDNWGWILTYFVLTCLILFISQLIGVGCGALSLESTNKKRFLPLVGLFGNVVALILIPYILRDPLIMFGYSLVASQDGKRLENK